jgi:hypothetical protein
MAILVQAVHVGLTGIVALATLLAGCPHIDCVCTNGRVLRYYPGIALGQAESECCHAEVKAGPATTSKSADESCPHCRKASVPASKQERLVDRDCCHKTLVAGALLATLQTQSSANAANAGPIVAVLGTLDFGITTDISSLRSTTAYRTPAPPPDLPVTLKHLLI